MLDFTRHPEYHGSSEEGALSKALSGMTLRPLKGGGDFPRCKEKVMPEGYREGFEHRREAGESMACGKNDETFILP